MGRRSVTALALLAAGACALSVAATAPAGGRPQSVVLVLDAGTTPTEHRAAKEKGAWAIGVDVDQSRLGPQILTSVLKRTDRGIANGIRRLTSGTFTNGGDLVYDLRNGGVGLGRISARIPKRLVARLEPVRRAIAAGTISVPTTVR